MKKDLKALRFNQNVFNIVHFINHNSRGDRNVWQDKVLISVTSKKQSVNVDVNTFKVPLIQKFCS